MAWCWLRAACRALLLSQGHAVGKVVLSFEAVNHHCNIQTMATKKMGSTLAALSAQIASLQAQADAMRKTEVAGVIAKAKDAIARYGLTAADLGLGSSPNNASKPSMVGRKSGPKPTNSASGKKSARPIKFKDGQGNTWGGMGKRPDWFNAALASGKKPEDLLANT